MIKKITTILIGIFIASILLTGCGGSTSSGDDGVNVVGSTSVSPLAESLGEAFSKKNEGIKVNIQSVGSSAGIKAVHDGTAEVGMSSRELSGDEKKGLTEELIALDGIAMIVNQENEIKGLTLEEINRIYRGEITNWKEVGGADHPIVIISREEGSGTRGAFEELTGLEYEEDGRTLTAVSPGAIIADGNGSVKQNVSTKFGAIGYVSLGTVDDSVKNIEVNGVLGTEENVKNGTYLIKRPFIFVTNGQVDENTKAYLEFVLSKEGQKVVEDNHYISII